MVVTLGAVAQFRQALPVLAYVALLPAVMLVFCGAIHLANARR